MKYDPKLIDFVLPESEQGYPAHLAAEDTKDVLMDCCGAASREFPASLWIEPKDWADKARDNDRYGTWPMNYIDRFTNQNPTHECTTHSLRVNFEGARNRARALIYPEGPKVNFRYDISAKFGSVWVSCQSIYAQVNPKTARNPKQRGGANVRAVMEKACITGMLPDKIQPFEYNFRHTLQGTSGKGGLNQSSGPYLSVKDFPEGWQETAKWFRPLEVIFPGSWEEAVCLVLHGIFVSVGRSGHAIPWGRWDVEDQVMAYPDSYDVIRYDSLRTVKSAWKGSFGIATVTVPDDWRYPAGGEVRGGGKVSPN